MYIFGSRGSFLFVFWQVTAKIKCETTQLRLLSFTLVNTNYSMVIVVITMNMCNLYEICFNSSKE